MTQPRQPYLSRKYLSDYPYNTYQHVPAEMLLDILLPNLMAANVSQFILNDEYYDPGWYYVHLTPDQLDGLYLMLKLLGFGVSHEHGMVVWPNEGPVFLHTHPGVPSAVQADIHALFAVREANYLRLRGQYDIHT